MSFLRICGRTPSKNDLGSTCHSGTSIYHPLSWSPITQRAFLKTGGGLAPQVVLVFPILLSTCQSPRPSAGTGPTAFAGQVWASHAFGAGLAWASPGLAWAAAFVGPGLSFRGAGGGPLLSRGRGGPLFSKSSQAICICLGVYGPSAEEVSKVLHCVSHCILHAVNFSSINKYWGAYSLWSMSL